MVTHIVCYIAICNVLRSTLLMFQASDSVQLVLWFKGQGERPIYTFDTRPGYSMRIPPSSQSFCVSSIPPQLLVSISSSSYYTLSFFSFSFASSFASFFQFFFSAPLFLSLLSSSASFIPSSTFSSRGGNPERMSKGWNRKRIADG